MYIISILLIIFGSLLTLKGGTLPRILLGGILLMAGITLILTGAVV